MILPEALGARLDALVDMVDAGAELAHCDGNPCPLDRAVTELRDLALAVRRQDAAFDRYTRVSAATGPFRVGRKCPWNVYRQPGDDPDAPGLPLFDAVSPEMGAVVVAALNAHAAYGPVQETWLQYAAQYPDGYAPRGLRTAQTATAVGGTTEYRRVNAYRWQPLTDSTGGNAP